MQRKYYIVEKYRRKGPFNIQELEKQGITRDTLVWTFELSDPIKASELVELSGLLSKQNVEKKEIDNQKTGLSDEELLKQYEEIKKQEEQNKKEEQNEQTILLENKKNIEPEEDKNPIKIINELDIKNDNINKEPEEQVIKTIQKEVIPPITQINTKENVNNEPEEHIKNDDVNKEPEERIFENSEEIDNDISIQEVSDESIIIKQKIENKEYTSDTKKQQIFTLKDKPPKPKNYVIWSILVLLFCCNPIAIGSLVIGAQVDKKYESGDFLGAEKASKTSLTLIIISILITAVGIIGLVLAENI